MSDPSERRSSLVMGVVVLAIAGLLAYAGHGTSDAVVFYIIAGLAAAIGLSLLLFPDSWYTGTSDGGGNGGDGE